MTLYRWFILVLSLAQYVYWLCAQNHTRPSSNQITDQFACDSSHSGVPANLEIELGELTSPYLFGVHLGVASSDLEQIERDHRGDVARQRSEVIKYWCRNNKCTWEKVADAVKKLCGHGNLEKKLRQLHTKGIHLIEIVVL